MRISQRAVARGGLTLGVLLLVVGAVLLALSATTPAYTDVAGYERAMDAVRQDYPGGAVTNHDAATDAFYAVLDRFETWKWGYADWGCSALAWAGLVLLVVVIRRGRGRGWTTRKLFPVLATTACGLALLFAGLLVGPLQEIGRGQIPAWADSYGIVLFSTFALMAILAPVVAVLTLSPILFTRRRPASLWSLGIGWFGGAVTGLVYMLPMFVAGILIATAGDAGGWATSTAGALLGWAFLNARAIWLGIHPAAIARPEARPAA